MKRSLLCIGIILVMFCAPADLPAAQAEPTLDEARLSAERFRRENILVSAAQGAYTPPAPGVMPKPDEIPLSGAWEDPDWDTPLIQSIYKNPYSYGNSLENYLPCLGEALGGNPKAMLAVSMFYYLWGYVLEEQYPDFPPQVHSVDFWRDWATRLTNPGWVRLHLGDLHGRWPASSLEYYRQAAELGNAEAMYNYYKATGKRLDYLYRSAALGYARAAFLLGEELEKRGGAENLALARRYTWLAAINADEWGLLHSSFSFYSGEFNGSGGNQTANCEQGYLYAILNMRYQYGNSFSTQRPDNICMLSPDAIGRLEAAADRWQADYDQRRLPYILRARYRSAPLIDELQAELAPLISRLGLRRPSGDELAQAGRGKSRGLIRYLPVAWHLGFFSDAEESRAHSAALTGFSDYADTHASLLHSRYIPWIYAFVIFSMFSGAALIAYSQYQKRKKKQRKKQKDENPPRRFFQFSKPKAQE